MIKHLSDYDIKIYDILLPFIVGVLGFSIGTFFDVLNLRHDYDKFEFAKKIDNSEILLKEGDIAIRLIPYLTGDDKNNRLLAVATVRHSLSNLGRDVLLSVIAQADEEGATKTSDTAKSALSSQRIILARALFDPENRERNNAYTALLTSWKDDPQIIGVLIDSATSFRGRENWPIVNDEPNEWLYKSGVLNTVNVLAEMNADNLKANMKKLCAFIAKESVDRPQTRKAGNNVVSKIGGCNS